MKTVNEIGAAAMQTGIEKGFYDNGNPPAPERIALMHSELSEALEAWRSHGLEKWYEDTGGPLPKPEGVASELADAIIRIADFAYANRINLDAAIEEKMAYNKTRPYRHGGKRI